MDFHGVIQSLDVAAAELVARGITNTRTSHETLKMCDSLEPVAVQGIWRNLDGVKHVILWEPLCCKGSQSFQVVSGPPERPKRLHWKDFQCFGSSQSLL
jgi:hypothetical protein